MHRDISQMETNGSLHFPLKVVSVVRSPSGQELPNYISTFPTYPLCRHLSTLLPWKAPSWFYQKMFCVPYLIHSSLPYEFGLLTLIGQIGKLMLRQFECTTQTHQMTDLELSHRSVWPPRRRKPLPCSKLRLGSSDDDVPLR